MQAAAPVTVQRCVGRILPLEIVYMPRGFVTYGFLNILVWVQLIRGLVPDFVYDGHC